MTLIASGWMLLGAGCSSLPDVNLTTDDPIKVDINVRLDVYQHQGSEGATKESADGADAEKLDSSNAEAIAKRKRDRMEEIQNLKNNRLVGENHRGLLTIRKLPPDTFGQYVKKTVNDENEDRNYLMRVEAKERNFLLHDVQEANWKANVERSFEGEWIEVAEEKEGSFGWKQKE